MIKFENVSKIFKVKEKRLEITKIALSNISLEIASGETVGLVGANGSGKSTLLKLLSTLYEPSIGRISIDDLDISTHSLECKKKLGVLFGGETGLYPSLTAKENIEYFGRLNGVNEALISQNMQYYSDFFNMGEYINRRVANFSRGMKQKVCFLRAVIHNPEIIVLDEPSTGLDVLGIEEVTSFIKYNQQQKHTIIISSHNMNEIYRNCEKIIILKQGTLAYYGDIKPLIKDTDKGIFSEIYHLMGIDNEYI
jgi:sodium transport system ATP-binding protein